jgi:hypothetical protein
VPDTDRHAQRLDDQWQCDAAGAGAEIARQFAAHGWPTPADGPAFILLYACSAQRIGLVRTNRKANAC